MAELKIPQKTLQDNFNLQDFKDDFNALNEEIAETKEELTNLENAKGTVDSNLNVYGDIKLFNTERVSNSEGDTILSSSESGKFIYFRPGGVNNANGQVVLKEKLPMPFGFGTAVVVSNSMYPYLEINDLIIVKKTNDYEVGDVIVYDDGSVLVVHRLVEIDDKLFVAKGDANDSNDREYSINLIKGEVVKIIPGMGVIQEVLANPFVKLGGLGLAFFLFELSFRIDKKKPKETDELEEEIKRLKEELHKDE